MGPTYWRTRTLAWTALAVALAVATVALLWAGQHPASLLFGFLGANVAGHAAANGAMLHNSRRENRRP